MALPPTEFLRECYHYEPLTGALWWKVRPDHHFSSPAIAMRANTKFAGLKVSPHLADSGYWRLEIIYEGKRRKFRLHRLIFAILYGHEPEQVDHINGNKLDNRQINLREATQSQNIQNRGVHRSKTDGLPRGVFNSATPGKYEARFGYAGVKRYLGTFRTVDEAKEAYDTAALAVHGEFFYQSASRRGRDAE